VISRNSCFSYKGRAVDARKIGRELGVLTVLEGSVRRAGQRLRITAQLVDAATGAQVWAERYDRDAADLFELQDEVTSQIVAALKVTLTPDEKTRLTDGGTANLDAYDSFLRGREFLYGEPKSKEKFEAAVAALNYAITLDPNYSKAYAALGWAYVFDFMNGWTSGRAAALALGRRNACLAVEKDPREPMARVARFLAALFEKDLDTAEQHAKKTLELDPNSALGYNSLGSVRIYAGEPMAAVPLVEQAIRLDPAWTKQYLHFLGVAYLVAGKFETAAAMFRQRISLSPETDFSRAGLASALGHLGESEEARRIWGELMRINPQYTFSDHFGRQPFRRAEDLERIAEGLRLAGLPAA
jgi:adenylate cyclase